MIQLEVNASIIITDLVVQKRPFFKIPCVLLEMKLSGLKLLN